MKGDGRFSIHCTYTVYLAGLDGSMRHLSAFNVFIVGGMGGNQIFQQLDRSVPSVLDLVKL